MVEYPTAQCHTYVTTERYHERGCYYTNIECWNLQSVLSVEGCSQAVSTWKSLCGMSNMRARVFVTSRVRVYEARYSQCDFGQSATFTVHTDER